MHIGKRPETKGKRPVISDQRPETRGKRPMIRDQRPKAKGKRPEIKAPRPYIHPHSQLYARCAEQTGNQSSSVSAYALSSLSCTSAGTCSYEANCIV